MITDLEKDIIFSGGDLATVSLNMTPFACLTSPSINVIFT